MLDVRIQDAAVLAIRPAVDAGPREGLEAGQESESRVIARLFTSHDVAEGVSAFLEERAPQFEHR